MLSLEDLVTAAAAAQKPNAKEMKVMAMIIFVYVERNSSSKNWVMLT